jgi:hypothetical protein
VSERTMLMELVESTESVEPDWQDALSRAGYGGRYFPRSEGPFRWRRAVVLAAVALTVIYAVAAAASDRHLGVVYWLFDRSSQTYPILQEPQLGEWTYAKRASYGYAQTDKGLVPTPSPDPQIWSVPVIQGEVVGQRFEMEAIFRRQTGSGSDLMVGLSPGGPAKPAHGTDVPGLGSAAGGFPVHGLYEPNEADIHWVGSTLYVPGPIEASGGGSGPKYFYGPAAADVRRVDLEGDHGLVVSAPTFAGPSDLGVNMRVWVAVLRLDQLVHTVVPRDENGHALERWHLQEAQ